MIALISWLFATVPRAQQQAHDQVISASRVNIDVCLSDYKVSQTFFAITVDEAVKKRGSIDRYALRAGAKCRVTPFLYVDVLITLMNRPGNRAI